MALRIRLGLLGANGTMDPMAPQLIRVINSLTLLMSINYYILLMLNPRISSALIFSHPAVPEKTSREKCPLTYPSISKI